MKTVFYSQHVLGVGHLFRSLEIAAALAPDEVVLVPGGRALDLALPANVRHAPLPPLMMDADFAALHAENGRDPEAVLAERRETFFELVRAEAPDVLLVELFPFGRKRFGFELLPVLKAVQDGGLPPMRCVCSLRDILVEKDDQAGYEARVLKTLNTYFHGLLVHTDPRVVRLEETFSRAGDIAVPRADTGYVAAAPEPGSGERLRSELGITGPLVVASAGGGSVGQALLAAVLEASALLAADAPHTLALFPGPYADSEALAALRARAAALPHVLPRGFSTRFPAWLDAADLSLSMAGYNTTMNLLAAGTYGLVLPFAQNREQAMRAGRLEALGALGVLDEADLAPPRLAARMAEALSRDASGAGVDLDGAAASAAHLRRWARTHG